MLSDFFFPKHCYACSKRGVYLCDDCFVKQVDVQYYQKCHVCSKPSRIGFVHSDCLVDTFLDGLIYITYYQGPIKKMISEGKYKKYSEIFEDLGVLSSQYVQNFYSINNSVVTSVPLHKSKLKERGFNQADVLGSRIARELGMEYKNIMNRKVKTKTQVGMSEVERRVNLRDAFVVEEDILPKKVILVDDVFTTGATMEECARILKLAGVAEVLALAVAKSGDRMV